jgi:hypothetical protein
MNWSDIKETVASAAPLVGTLLGGPAGSAVGSLVAGALGVEESPAAVMRALGDPDKAAELQRWAYEHQERLESIRLETLRAELADTADARKNHKDSNMPAFITVAMTLILGGLLYTLFSFEIPESNKEVAYMLFGQASALWAASISYWVGTTRSSSDKTKLIRSN